jgi:signal transduction histidine kinase
MLKTFKKHLILLFVVPNTILFLVFILLILFIPQFNKSVIFYISFIAIILAINLVVVNYLDAIYEKVNMALRLLFQEQTDTIEFPKKNNLFGPFIKALENISMHIRHQQDELRHERESRLRSMIDGQDQERQRLSRELHDGVGQSLIAVRLNLENACELGYSQMRASLDVSKEMIDGTIDEVRRVTNALVPAALSEFGLVVALRNRCEEMANMANIELSFESSGSLERLERKSKMYLYRIALEAITNTIKHARASRLTVKLNRTGQEVVLLVSDNGKGFNFEQTSFANCNGIQNIRERIAILQGTFDVKSRPNTGTTLLVTIPYLIENGKNKHHTG